MITYCRKSWAAKLSGKPDPTISTARNCFVQHYVPRRGGLEVVDIGAGSHSWVKRLAGKFEFKRGLLVDLMRSPGVLPANVEFLKADLEKTLPIPTGSFDVVASISVIEHLRLEGRRICMKEISRILRPGGRALLTIAVFHPWDSGIRRILSTDKGMMASGNSVFADPDIADVLACCPDLKPVGEVEPLDRFPGYPGHTGLAPVFEDPDVLKWKVSCLTLSQAVYYTEVCFNLVKGS